MPKSLIFFCTLFLFASFSCNNNPDSASQEDTQDSNFTVVSDSTEFIKPEAGFLSLLGPIVFKNNTAYDFNMSDGQVKEAMLYVVFSDDETESFHLPFFGIKDQKWLKETNFKIELMPFQLTGNIDTIMSIHTSGDILNERKLREEDFKRTPKDAYIKISIDVINIDKELPLEYTADVLDKWKKYQTNLGLR